MQGLDDILWENNCLQFNYFPPISWNYLVVWDTNTAMGPQVFSDLWFLDSPICNHWHDIRIICEEIDDLTAGFEADRFITQALASPFRSKIEENCFALLSQINNPSSVKYLPFNSIFVNCCPLG